MLTVSALALGASAFLTSHRHQAPAKAVEACHEIAGTFQFVETVNEYDDSEVGYGTPAGGVDHICNGGVGFLHIEKDCTWTYKKIKNDPHVCEDDSGFSQSPVKRTEVEYWTIRRFNTQSAFNANVGAWIEDIVFTIETIPGFLHGHAKRIQGVIEKVNGCDISFEGWEVQRPDVNHCFSGYSQGVPISKREAVEEQSARLTSSSSSSASASDIKDALAKIAAALPKTFGTSSSSSSTSSSYSEAKPCAGIAGIYQFVETVNEYDNSDLLEAQTPAALTPAAELTYGCSGGIGFIDIHENCEWIYKKIVVGGDGTAASTAQYCIDDAGFAGEGPVTSDETEFWQISREGIDQGDDFRFSIEKLAGDSKAPTRIQGIIEKDNGCDLAFEGWLTDRKHLHACRDQIATK